METKKDNLIRAEARVTVRSAAYRIHFLMFTCRSSTGRRFIVVIRCRRRDFRPSDFSSLVRESDIHRKRIRHPS